MISSRQKRLAFIQGFGPNALRDRVAAMIAEMGHDFLNDAQIALMTERQVEDARFSQHLKIRNRKIYAARRSA